MAKKLIILTLGTVLLSSAWMGIVTSVKNSQEMAYKESLPLKFSVVQSKWARLLSFNPLQNGQVVKPAAFVYTLGAGTLDLVDFKSPGGTIRTDLGIFKSAYLDAGKEAPFFSVEAQDDRYLVRAVRQGEKLKFIGYSLDSVLNFLGTRLEDNEWFLMDSKNRILAAHQGAYVGQPYTFDGTTQKFKFEQSKHRFTFAIQQPQSASLVLVNFLGIFGIVLMAGALFVFKDEPTEGASEAAAVDGLELGKKPLVENLGLDSEVDIEENDFTIDRDLENSAEGVQMVDLQVSKAEPKSKESSRLDYTEFLIDNPVLRPTTAKTQIADAPQVDTAPSVTHKETLDAPTEVKQDDWIKMAEELSANIDKFTKSIQEDELEKKSNKEV